MAGSLSYYYSRQEVKTNTWNDMLKEYCKEVQKEEKEPKKKEKPVKKDPKEPGRLYKIVSYWSCGTVQEDIGKAMKLVAGDGEFEEITDEEAEEATEYMKNEEPDTQKPIDFGPFEMRIESEIIQKLKKMSKRQLEFVQEVARLIDDETSEVARKKPRLECCCPKEIPIEDFLAEIDMKLDQDLKKESQITVNKFQQNAKSQVVLELTPAPADSKANSNFEATNFKIQTKKKIRSRGQEESQKQQTIARQAIKEEQVKLQNLKDQYEVNRKNKEKLATEQEQRSKEADIEYQKKLRKQKEELDEFLKKSKESREKFEKETQRLQEESRKKLSQKLEFIMQCYLTKIHFEKEEEKWKDWLEVIRNSIAKVEKGAFTVEFENYIGLSRLRRASIMNKIIHLHRSTLAAYDIVTEAWRLLKILSGSFPDKIFIRILLKNFGVVAKKILRILEEIDKFLENPSTIIPITDSLASLNSFDILTTRQLREQSVNMKHRDFDNLEEPLVYKPSSNVKIEEIFGL